MREYFQKIIAWAKAHPWLAAGILGGIVLVLWLAIRNGWFGGGGGDGETAAVPDGGGGGIGATPDLSNLPDMSALPGGGIGTAPNPIPVGINMPASPSSLPASSTFSDLPSYPTEGSYAGGYPLASSQGATLAEIGAPSPQVIQSSVSQAVAKIAKSASQGSNNTPSSDAIKKSVSQVSNNIANSYKQQKPPKEDKKNNKSKSPSPVVIQSSVTDAMAKIAGGASQGTSQNKSSGKTPAQLLGKGKNFTGWINGVHYVNGYPG